MSFLPGWACPESTSTEFIILWTSGLIVGGQLAIITFLFMFVCSQARQVILRRGEIHSQHGTTEMEINDNPTFVIDGYDIIPDQYLDKKNSVYYHLSQRRGSSGKFNERYLLEMGEH